ncbi:MAG TPA: alpha/beta fold hydrolase [Myxococcota bacterium]|nr:alpha/beta fold hydrolase [Myxococcota bacterium]
MLNVGGLANPDVLLVRREVGAPVVVKDWSRRGPLVRAFLGPLLARHELAMLERVEGLPGLPRPCQRIDRLALALEFVAGRPLRRRTHGRALPSAFFIALEGILEGLRLRGVAYLDLRSPTNVLVTPSSAPALVDLGSALALPLPRALRAVFERRALAKLRARFEGSESESAPAGDAGARDLKLGGTRFHLRDHGRPDDPLPILMLPDVGLSARVFAPIAERAAAHGRRVIGVDLPGFGGSRAGVSSLRASRVAAQLEALVDALRIARFDLLAQGWSVLPAAALAARVPERARRLVALDARTSEGSSDPERLRALVQAGLPSALAPALRAELEAELARAPARTLRLAARAAGRAMTPIGVGGTKRIELRADEALVGEALFEALAPD